MDFQSPPPMAKCQPYHAFGRCRTAADACECKLFDQDVQSLNKTIPLIKGAFGRTLHA